MNLTPQQLKVLRGLMRGLSNKEIALELDLSLPTIKSHVSGIYRALNVSKRYEAIREAEVAGIQFPE